MSECLAVLPSSPSCTPPSHFPSFPPPSWWYSWLTMDLELLPPHLLFLVVPQFRAHHEAEPHSKQLGSRGRRPFREAEEPRHLGRRSEISAGVIQGQISVKIIQSFLKNMSRSTNNAASSSTAQY